MKKLNFLSGLALLTLSTTAAANTPACLSPASDSDGDGWGWENGQSCLVTAEQTAAADDNGAGDSTTVINGVPVCSSPAFDPDGDGWGWENNGTCIVAAGSAVVSVAISPTEASATGDSSAANGPSVCSSSAFDEDGDGWGWENNASCIVVAGSTGTVDNNPAEPQEETSNTSPIESAAPASVTPVAQAPLELRIMALGDSITHGHNRDLSESYRKPFIALLASNQCEFEMVGSQTGNHLHNTFISPHEGYNGHTADEILNGLSNDAGNNEGISVTAPRFQPDVVLLHIGTNDMRLRQDIGSTIAEIDQIISIILAQDSTPTVLIANVIPWYANATIGADIEVLGDRIEAYVSQLGNARVQLVDVRTGFTSAMVHPDGVHPNPTGEAFLADRFFNAYNSAGFCR